MRWASGAADDSRGISALRVAAAELESGLDGASPDLVLLFVSSAHRTSYAEIAKESARLWPNALLVGCSAHSVIGGGEELEGGPGLALCAGHLPGVELHPFHLTPEQTLASPSDVQAWRGMQQLSGESFLLLGDPFSCATENVLQVMDARFPERPKLGGLASGGERPGENVLYLGERLFQSGLVGVAFEGRIRIDTIIAQGCRPIGAPLFATRCHENVIHELDGRRPLDILHELFERSSAQDQTLFSGSLFLGLEMRAGRGEYHQGDFLVRNLIGADEESGAIAVAAQVREHQVVQFHLRDAQTSAADLERSLAGYEEMYGGAATGALLFSCLGRGAHLYGRVGHESEAFRRHLGPVPLSGFFCNGEIGPVQERSFLHGYTSAFGLFRDPSQ